MVVFEYTLRIVHVKLFSSSNYSLETDKFIEKGAIFPIRKENIAIEIAGLMWNWCQKFMFNLCDIVDM